MLWRGEEPFPSAGFVLLVYLHAKAGSLTVGKPVLERSKMKLSTLILDYMTKVVIF